VKTLIRPEPVVLTEKPNYERWARKMSFIRGPFKFSYIAYYKAKEGDEFWTLVSLEKNGHEPVEYYSPNEKMELIKKFGKQAKRAAHETAEKPMRFSRERKEISVFIPI